MQAPSPAASPPAPPPFPAAPRGLAPQSPAPRAQPAAGGQGTRGSCATAGLGGGGNARPGAAPAASRLGKSSLLLAKANTALFFPSAPARPALRQPPGSSSPGLRVSRGSAGRAEPPPGKSPSQLRTQGAPGGPEGARVAQRPRTLPPPPRAAQRTGSLESGVPARGRGCRGAGRLRAPGSSPQRRRERTPPAGPDPVTFPPRSRAKETRSRRRG